MRRTKLQAAITRQTILDAAERLFVARGYDQVSLDQIAEAAGVKRGAVHFHFINKPGVLVAMCEDDRLRLQALVERLEQEPSAVPLHALRQVLVEMLTAYQGDDHRRALMRAVMSTSLQLVAEEREVFLEFQRRLLAVIAAVFEAAAKRGQLGAAWTARSAARALFAVVTGLFLLWATGDAEMDLVPGGVEALRAVMASFEA